MEQPPSPSLSLAPVKYDLADTATTITDISEDLLRKIFLLLPSLPSLVRAALACPTFLCAIRSCPAFRRHFRELHPPQLLGFFSNPCRTDTPAFLPLLSRSDPGLAAAVRGSDFLLTGLPEDSGDPGWAMNDCRGGYVLLHNHNTGQIAAYNPISQALDIFPCPVREAFRLSDLYFRIVFSEEDRRSFRVVCVRRWEALARISVFSSDSRKWLGFSWEPRDDEAEGTKCVLLSYTAATPANEFDTIVLWKHKHQAYMVVLNGATLQLSRMDLPPSLKYMDSTEFKLGRTKDGDLAMVFMDPCSLAVWFWRTDAADGVEKWMPHKTFPPDKFDFIPQVVAVIDGLVYLCTTFSKRLLSLCLKTEEVNELSETIYDRNIYPYIMAWPPSLVCNKEDLETKVTIDGLADDGPAGTVMQR